MPQPDIINDRYQIIERIGEGGMAYVYRAEDKTLGRTVALKMIRTDEIPPSQLERILQRFQREARNLAVLSDVPGVVTLLDYGIHNNMPYLVMTYMPGGTLKDKLGAPIPIEEAVSMLQPIIEALIYVHEMDIIHRDIKPSNLLIDRFGRLALADFGIAKAFDMGDHTLTGTGLGVGTAAYMAPEQWRGQSGKQSDIYSLGVVLYEMLTGRKPFEGETASDVFLKVMTEPLPDPREFVPGLSPQVFTLLQRMLNKDLDKRIPTVEAMQTALTHLCLPQAPESPPVLPTDPLVESFDTLAEDDTYDVWEAKEQLQTNPEPPVPQQQVSVNYPVHTPSSRPINPNPPRTSPTTANKKQASWLTMVGIVLSIGLIIGCILLVQLNGATVSNPPLSNTQARADNTSTTTPTPAIALTEQARATEDAKFFAASTATAEMKQLRTIAAEKTQTAMVQQTATQAVVQKRMSESEAKGVLELSGVSGTMAHNEDGYVKTYWTGINTKNFILEAMFGNPYGHEFNAWNFGVMFRHTGSNDQYRLYIMSSGDWTLRNNTGDSGGSVIQSGRISGLNIQESGSNTLKLYVMDDVGILIINDEHISNLDLSHRTVSGSILLGTGFLGGTEVEGYATTFSALSIWQLPSVLITDPEQLAMCQALKSNVSVATTGRDGNNYKYVFYNPNTWPNDQYSLYADSPNSTLCSIWPSQIDCSVDAGNSQRLTCERFRISYWGKVASNCDIEIDLQSASCGSLIQKSWSVAMPASPY